MIVDSAFALFLATSQLATPSEGMLWGNVAYGMPVSELRALHARGARVAHRPDRTIVRQHRLTPECTADLSILHPRGRATEVILEGEPAILGRCGTAVLEGLQLQFGQPISAVTARPSIFKRVRTTYRWRTGSVDLTFVLFSTEGWGGAGLGNPSWTLRVSKSQPPQT